MGGWMDGWVDGWMGGWVDGWMGGWMDGWVDGWVDGGMDGLNKVHHTTRINGWTNEQNGLGSYINRVNTIHINKLTVSAT